MSLEVNYYLNKLICVKNKFSTTTVICFSGAIAGNHFHFFKSFDKRKVNVIYVKESEAGWYQYGLPGASTIEGLGKYLLNILSELGTTELYCFGSSMGSYAAILYGSLFNATRILTFGARTYVHPDFLTNSKVVEQKGVSESYRELFHYVERYTHDGGHLVNVCGSDEWLDIFHLSDVYRLNGVDCYTIDNAGHNVGALLKHRGVLNRTVNGLLDGDFNILKPVDSFIFSDSKVVDLVKAYINKSRTGSLDECLKLLLKEEKNYPLWVILQQKLLVIALKLRNKEVASEAARKLVQLDKTMLKGVYWRAKLLLLEEKWQDAYDLFIQVLINKPGLASPLEVRKLNLSLAYCSYKLNLITQANQYLTDGLSGLNQEIKLETLTMKKALGF